MVQDGVERLRIVKSIGQTNRFEQLVPWSPLR